MDYDRLFDVIRQLELPSDCFIVVGGAVLLVLPESWREQTEDLDLVVSAEGARILAERDWERVPGAVETPILVGEVDGVKVEAAATWGMPELWSWNHDELRGSAIEVDGVRFAHPAWVIEWKGHRGQQRTDPNGKLKDLADVAAWRNWIRDEDRWREFMIEHPPQVQRPELEVTTTLALNAIQHGLLRGSVEYDGLVAQVASTRLGRRRLRELGVPHPAPSSGQPHDRRRRPPSAPR